MVFFRANSSIQIDRKFETKFEECLFQQRCLVNGTLPFLNCLLNKCPIEEFLVSDGHSSSLLKCLSDDSSFGIQKRSLFFTYGIRRGDIEVTDWATTTTTGDLTSLSQDANGLLFL